MRLFIMLLSFALCTPAWADELPKPTGKNFTAEKAWGATDIANFDGTTVRLHWVNAINPITIRNTFSKSAH